MFGTRILLRAAPTLLAVVAIVVALHFVRGASVPSGASIRRDRGRPALDGRDPDDPLLRGLRSLPYLQGSRPAPGRSGVTIHDPKRAYPGFNFYTSGHAVEAGVMDMRGRVLHRWRRESEPALEALRREADPADLSFFTHLRRAHLGRHGEILGLYTGLLLVKLAPDSSLVWTSEVEYPHHQMRVDEEGNVYVLAARFRSMPGSDGQKMLIDDEIAVLDPQGRILHRHSLYQALKNSEYSGLLDRLRPEGEVFHTNTLQVFDGSLASRSPLYRKGNVLVSILYLNTIAIVSLPENRVLWALNGDETGLWNGMHEPTVLADGNMLIFDNNWREPGVVSKSRVVEFDPFTQKVVWVYEGDAAHPFYSRTCGSVQRLPNGNTLVTETEGGRAFEVTRDKQIVWEYRNPHRAGKHGELIASLLEVRRVEPADLGWLTWRR